MQRFQAQTMKSQEMLKSAAKQKHVPEDGAEPSFVDRDDPFVQEDYSSGDSFQPKSLQLDFPRFDSKDPYGWCYKATQFFEYYAMADQQKFNLATFHMEGKALIWFQELPSTNKLDSWIEFLKAIRIRFGKGSYDDRMETLSKLQQIGELEKYKSQFEVLANRVHDFPEHHKLSCFLGVLRQKLGFLSGCLIQRL
jgi:hypothetical protein